MIRSTTQDLFVMIDGVQAYVQDAPIPAGYELMTWSDESVEVRGRLDLLLENGAQGLLIVFTLLLLFLDPKLAFWVAVGIPFAILASGIFLYLTGQTLNLISMFAFVMALGIVVDDAIVVGENVYSHRQMGKPIKQAAIEGTAEVIPSVTTAVLTTVVMFAPLLFVSGTMGKFTAVMPAAIIAILLVSLLECLTILPCHLAHRNLRFFQTISVVFYVFRPLLWLAQKLNAVSTGILNRFTDGVYTPSLAWCLKNRSVAISISFAALLVTAGLYRSGLIQLSFFPRVDGNTLNAAVTFPDGTPESVTVEATQKIEDAFWQVADTFEKQGRPIAKTSFRVVGASVAGGGPGGSPMPSASGGHKGSVEIELINSESRGVHSREIVAKWRERIPAILGQRNLRLELDRLAQAGHRLNSKCWGHPKTWMSSNARLKSARCSSPVTTAVYDVKDDSVPGKLEYRFRIKPEAFGMGVRTADLAETVRAAYYGEEVMRVQRGRHEVKIMVTYPREDRRSLANFDEVRVRLADGLERPITELAEIDVVRAYSELNRIDQARSITVSSNLDEEIGNAEEIVGDLQAKFVPDLLLRYPSLRIRWEGQQERRAESFGSLFSGFFAALLAMFVLLAVEFKSAVQPLLVMLIIPFGALGAVIGHVIMGLRSRCLAFMESLL